MAMTEEARAARREYDRRYYQSHKAAHRARQERYWAKKAAKERQGEEVDEKHDGNFPVG